MKPKKIKTHQPNKHLKIQPRNLLRENPWLKKSKMLRVQLIRKKSEEVFVEPAKMTREGDLEFGFSEELHVPGFIKGEADD